jgi:hypothetical protein
MGQKGVLFFYRAEQLVFLQSPITLLPLLGMRSNRSTHPA